MWAEPAGVPMSTPAVPVIVGDQVRRFADAGIQRAIDDAIMRDLKGGEKFAVIAFANQHRQQLAAVGWLDKERRWSVSGVLTHEDHKPLEFEAMVRWAI